MEFHPDFRGFTPTMCGFILVLAYVVTVTNLLGVGFGHDPAVSNATALRSLEMELYLDRSVDGCTNFYDHACGGYDRSASVDPWREASGRSLNVRRRGAEYARCLSQPPEFWVPPNASAWVIQGFSVNNVTVRPSIFEGRYFPELFVEGSQPSGDPVSEWCWCVGHPVLVSRPTADCAQLCSEPSTTKIPTDFPQTCDDVIDMFRGGSDAPTVPQSVATFVEARFRRLETASGLSGLGFHVGGGAGHAPDVDWLPTVGEMWLELFSGWDTRWNTSVSQNAWSSSGWSANAYYSSDQSAIFVNWGFLQPPFFSPNFSEALLVGSLDFVLAHELGHAVDFETNQSCVRHAIVDVLARRAGVNRSVAAVTGGEDFADRHATTVLASPPGGHDDAMYYQFGQMWCGERNSSFSGDVHAPSRWRVNLTAPYLPGWSRRFCGRDGSGDAG